MDEATVRSIIQNVLEKFPQSGSLSQTVPRDQEITLETSARHVHLTQEAVEKLFGEGATLGVVKALSQPGEFLSDKRVKLITPAGDLANVAVLGPVREAIQVELSATDCRTLKLQAPVNVSGDLSNAADVSIMGDKGIVEAKGSVIVAKAHVHLTRALAAKYGLKDRQSIRVRIDSARPITLDDVIVRVSDSYAPIFHIDTDESNACGVDSSSRAFIQIGPETCVSGQDSSAGPSLTWSGELLNEAAARMLLPAHQQKTVYLCPKTKITPAAWDVIKDARMEVEFVV